MAAKLPGVYVTVEDRSYVEDQVASGRTGLIVIMSDRGPENRVVQVNSNSYFFMKYGKPVIETTGQAHYIASQFLKRSNQLYVIRAALLDSPNPTHNCSLANVAIRYTPTEGGTEEILSGDFIFTAVGPVDLDGLGPMSPRYAGQWDLDNAYNTLGSEYISKYVFCNYIGYNAVNIDDYISIDGSYESIQVVSKGQIPAYNEVTGLGQGTSERNYVYYLELASYYTGRSTETNLGNLPIVLRDQVPILDANGVQTKDENGVLQFKVIKSVVDTLIAERDSLVDPATPERIAEINVAIKELTDDLDNYTFLLYDSAFTHEDAKFKSASKYYFGPKVVSFANPIQGDLNHRFYPTCNFTKGTNVVYCENEQSFESIYEEEWIMAASDHNIAEGKEISPILRQIVNKFAERNNVYDPNDVTYKFILDDVYTGNSTGSTTDINGNTVLTYDTVYSHVPVQVVSSKSIKSDTEFNTNDVYNMFYFYAQGVGRYYNNIFIQGVRNYQLERMYTDDNGVPLYKYMFMDMTIYGQNPDGTRTILEGPWTVSLVNKVGDQVVRDIHTGRELYIVNTINERSEYIKCKEGINASILEGLTKEKEELRLKVMALFSVSFVYRTKTRGQEGFFLENGGDGIQYDVFGRLNIYHPEIAALIRSAYGTDLTSHDGSIQLLMQTLYPWYILDYVISGGYDVDAQYAALELVDTRKDCLLLADTGRYSLNAREDLTSRAMDVPWNSWNAALYTQYSEITDPYSGKALTISPVYHAVERHLTVDNNYFLSEPVAGIEKGAIQMRAKLAYKPTLADMQEMIEVELNPIITEPDGTYFLTQFSTYKRMSVMKRLHAVKFIHHLQHRLPSILKDLLQRKGTPYWISVAESRVDTFMRQFTNANSPKHSCSSYNVNVVWDEDRSEIFIGLTVHPLRAIEAINVNIIVT
mgnify:CR=1 FL=1